MQFVNHPEIPEETRSVLLERQSVHLKEINEEIAAMTELLRQKGLLP
jgi:L-lysine 2,3-aminomutase